MKLVRRHIASPDSFETSWLTFYLGQIVCDLDPDQHRVVDVDRNRARVDALLEMAFTHGPGAPVIAILPEMGMAAELLPDVIDSFGSAPRNVMLIAGLDRLTVAEVQTLVTRHGGKFAEQTDFLSTVSDNALLNTTAILTHGPRKPELKLQFKQAPSKLEVEGPFHDQDIEGPPYLPCYSWGGLHFIVVTCSDLFTRAPQARARTIDELDYNLWRTGSEKIPAPTLLINHQRTFDSADRHFVDSLRRIYDGTMEQGGSARSLGTVMLNHAVDALQGGGESTVLLHKSTVRPNRHLGNDWIKAPVWGYRAPRDELVMKVGMRRPDLIGSEDTDVIRTELRPWSDGGGWNAAKGLKTKYVLEEDALPVHRASLLDVASTMAEHQHFEAAIGWARRAHDTASPRDYLRRAQAMHDTAVNTRRAGRLHEADALFQEGLALAERVKTVEGKVLAWRIKLSRITLLEYVLGGVPKDALDQIEEIEQEVDREGLRQEIPEDFALYQMHVARQRGEMTMSVGSYGRAYKEYLTAYDGYGWESYLDKALALVGVAHAELLRGNYENAFGHLRDVRRFLRSHPESRVRWRYLRFACELDALHRLGISSVDPRSLEEDPAGSLRELLEEKTFRIESIYGALALGAIALHTDPALALDQFEQAENLANGLPLNTPIPPPSKLDIERMKIERMHALLGQAEAHRLLGDADKAKAMYQKAVGFYRDHKVNWGLSRALLGLYVGGGPRPPNRPRDAPGKALTALVDGRVGDVPLFVCMP